MPIPEHTINKVVYDGNVLIDLTGDTVTTNTMLSGATAHDASGAPITGACTYDSDTTDATALVAEVLDSKTFYARGNKLTGIMPNRGAVTGVISTKDQTYAIQQGYHDGSGSVGIDATERAKIIPSNIKDGVSILGETGTYTGEGVTAQAKTVTPTSSQQTVLPDSGYDYLSQVTVNAIPYVESLNAAGGYTATIGQEVNYAE